MKTKILILGVITWLLCACSGSEIPKLIAAQRAIAPLATFPLADSPPITILYTTTIDLEVNRVDRANSRVREITYQQGGYVSDSQIWYQDGEEHVMLQLVIPTYRFESVRSELLRLGEVKNERLSGTPLEPDEFPRQDYTQIIVFLHPKIPTRFLSNIPDWRPLHTLEQAWKVSLAIFGFLLDVAIWLLVVGGPFVLLAWGIQKLITRRKKSAEEIMPQHNSDSDS
jgi:hypothetical protein